MERPYLSVEERAWKPSNYATGAKSDFICLPIKAIHLAKVKIYILCLGLAELIFTIFTRLNFWQGYFSYPSNAAVATVFTLIAYELFALGLVSPLFYGLQVVLHQRITRKSTKICLFASEPVRQSILFCTVLFYILPLFEAIKLSTGLAGLQLDVVRFFIQLSAIIGIFPYFPTALILLISSRSTQVRLRGISKKDINQNLQFLNSEDFRVALLKSKSDEHLNSLIEVAKLTNNMVRADLISRYLLNRSLSSDQQSIEKTDSCDNQN